MCDIATQMEEFRDLEVEGKSFRSEQFRSIKKDI